MNQELKPCPFCGDPMRERGGLIQHVEQTEGCPIRQEAWDSGQIDRWNRRTDALEGGVTDGRYPSVFYSNDRSVRVSATQYRGYDTITINWRNESMDSGCWYTSEFDPEEARQLALHILAKPALQAALSAPAQRVEEGTRPDDGWRDEVDRQLVAAYNAGASGEEFDMLAALSAVSQGGTPTPDEWPDVEEDDPDVLAAAKAIAEHGIGRPWDDFLPVNAYDFDHGDLIEYGRAAVAALRSASSAASLTASPAPAPHAGVDAKWLPIETAPKGCVTEDAGCRGSSEWFFGRVSEEFRKQGAAPLVVIRRRAWPQDDSWADNGETHYVPRYFDAWAPIDALLSDGGRG